MTHVKLREAKVAAGNGQATSKLFVTFPAVPSTKSGHSVINTEIICSLVQIKPSFKKRSA